MKTFVVLLLSVLSCTVAQAQRTDLDFLGQGKTYVIRFANDHIPFIHRTSHKSTSLEVFKVVQLGSGSWAQLEYPANSADYGKWNEKLRAQATLTDAETSEPKEAAGANFRETADQAIATKRSWINLDHAIEISDVLSGLPFGLEFNKP